MMIHRVAPLLPVLVFLAAPVPAAADDFQDMLVQPPALQPPERGSVAGTLARAVFGPGDLSRGAFELPTPISAPTDHGPLLAPVFPTYSPESGLGEWGMGWHVGLAIRRFRPAGDLDYQTDVFESPWGQLQRGSDGAWYPLDFSGNVRLIQSAAGWTAALADGTRFSFHAADAITNARGTYAWMLSEVTTAIGERTALTYTRNASGRPFLTAVEYGGRAGSAPQYRIELAYEPMATAFEDYRSGALLVLDRRVSEVRVLVASTGSLRWRHRLEYQTSSTGPAFFLSAVTKVAASGASEPSIRYQYDIGEQAFSQAVKTTLTDLDAFLAAAGPAAIQPIDATMVDIDEDGRMDFEHAANPMILHHTDGGWRAEQLPPLDGTEHPWCRSPPSLTNKPRTLAKMTADAKTPQVVVTWASGTDGKTSIVICDRPGHLLQQSQVDGVWRFDATTRLVDLNRDHRPDFIQVFDGLYHVLENVSDAHGFVFKEHALQPLSPAFMPSTIWVHDLNGDGIPDLIGRGSDSLEVWYGKGNFEFETEGRAFALREDGVDISLDQSDLSFFDANKDGLTDVFVRRESSGYLYLNQGTYFLRTPVPALDTLPPLTGYPVAADLSGGGNAEIVVTDNTHAYAVDLSRASTGLMTSADDGKGSGLRFQYTWAPPIPGLKQRSALVQWVESTSAGRDDLTFVYGFGHPVLHSQGQYLLGYEDVVRQGAHGIERVHFTHDDLHPALVRSTTTTDDRLSNLAQFTTHRYDEVEVVALSWARPERVESGWIDPTTGARVSKVTAYANYEQNFCATTVQTTEAAGVLTRTTVLATAPVFPDAPPHCLAQRTTLAGVHADASLDFTATSEAERNEVGQVVKVTGLGPDGPLVLQQAHYDDHHRLDSLTRPGRGTLRVQYEGESSLIREIDSPDGTATRVSRRDPVTSAMLEYQIDRGDGVVYDTSFRYDDLERLAKLWDNAGASSEAVPLESVGYVYAGGDRPGSVERKKLVSDEGVALFEDVAELFAGDGATFAAARRIPEGWSIGGLTRTFRGTRQEQALHRHALVAADASSMSFSALYAGADTVGSSDSTTFDQVIGTSAIVQQGVERKTASTFAIQGGALVETTVENGANPHRTACDASGQVVWSQDQTQARLTRTYDASGKLVGLQLPGGARHTVRYDGYRRVKTVSRDGIARIDYAYDPASGLLANRTVSTPAGRIVERVTWSRDALGRTVDEVHTAPQTGASRKFHFDYDGVIAGEPRVPGQLGKLSRVTGDGFEKRMRYDAQERLVESRLSFPGWRTVVEAQTYFANGKVRSRDTRVLGADGVPVNEVVEGYTYDAWGRLGGVSVGGQKLYDLRYDGDGNVAQALFVDGRSVTVHYDPVTGAPTGFWHDARDWNAGVEVRMNTRGLVDTETYRFGADYWERAYQYESRGFLAGSNDHGQTSAYTYDADGLIASIQDESGSRALVRTARSTIVAGATAYDLDDLGRVVRRRTGAETTALTYGPTGEVDQATREGRTWSFVYDEGGHRLLKREVSSAGAKAVAGFIGDSFLDEQRIVMPVRVGDRLIGYLANGQFEMLATDPRGTVIGEGGSSDVPSPYGVRARHPEIAAAIDFVEKGFDADLGVVRMGARDYDPALGQYLTPDPALLEDVERCAERPAECNLYGYAANDPIKFTDPSGREASIAGIWSNFADHAGDFAGGAASGFAAGVAVGAAMGVLTVVAAPVATVLSVGALAYTAYQIADQHRQIADMAGRLAAGEGTAGDWSAVGSFLGGTVGGSLGFRGGARIASEMRPATCAGSCGVGSRSCFAAGTLVATASGLVPIESITDGDLVWARDPQTAELALKPVLKRFRHEVPGLLALELQAPQGVDSEVDTTPEHPFWVKDRGWINAGELVEGDRVMDLAGGWLRVDAIARVRGLAPVYNLEIAESHTYFVGELAAWVHNNCGDDSVPLTSNAARREVMRQQGIPTSQTPASQAKNASGWAYEYEVPKPGGGTEIKSVQQQTLDVSHPGQGHWEAGRVKIDPDTNEIRMNKYGRPKLTNGKSKVDYE